MPNYLLPDQLTDKDEILACCKEYLEAVVSNPNNPNVYTAIVRALVAANMFKDTTLSEHCRDMMLSFEDNKNFIEHAKKALARIDWYK